MSEVHKGRQAVQEQTVNAVDGAAARFRDHLDLKINEHYRMAHPAEVPPTLSLTHGNDFIRVIKADGGLHREAVAFVARSTGNVYLAATWDRPKPVIIANVLESDTWRQMKMAFDQYNVPELLGQIKKVLHDKGLGDTWDELKKCQAPKKVNDAWMSLSKKERKRKAARLDQLRIMRLAASGEDFINPKTKAMAKKALTALKKMKASYSNKVDMPSNVGGFIIALFRMGMWDRGATTYLNRYFGNNNSMGTGLGLDRELDALAGYYQRLNNGEKVAVGMLMLRSVRRPSVAQGFEDWAKGYFNLDQFDASADTAAPMSPSKVFDGEVKGANRFAGGLLMQLGTGLVEAFCYRLAENINWHSINRTGLLGAGEAEGATEADYELVQRLVQKASGRVDYGIEPAATLIVALMRRAKMKGKALAVKRYALKNLPGSFEAD